MKLLLVSFGAWTLLAAAGAEAHARLKSSTPREGTVLTQSPDVISLTFSERARLTAVWLQKEQEPKKALTAPSAAGEQLSIAVRALAPGAYTLSWRLLSIGDNHITSGQLRFTVGPARH